MRGVLPWLAGTAAVLAACGSDAAGASSTEGSAKCELSGSVTGAYRGTFDLEFTQGTAERDNDGTGKISVTRA